MNQPVIPHEQQRELLTSNRNHDSRASINFSCFYNTTMDIKEILTENLTILATNDHTRSKLLSKPLIISYKHSQNLSQKLVRAKLDQNINTEIATHPPPLINTPSFAAKNISCRHPQCGTCKQLSSRANYYSHQTKHYEIPEIYSCDTVGAMYLLDCKICGKQYVGETGTILRSRIKHHKNALHSNLNRPIYKQAESHQGSFEILITDVKTSDRKLRQQRYINLLKTTGLNVIKKLGTLN